MFSATKYYNTAIIGGGKQLCWNMRKKILNWSNYDGEFIQVVGK